jgi:hypothetical protein
MENLLTGPLQPLRGRPSADFELDPTLEHRHRPPASPPSLFPPESYIPVNEIEFLLWESAFKRVFDQKASLTEQTCRERLGFELQTLVWAWRTVPVANRPKIEHIIETFHFLCHYNVESEEKHVAHRSEPTLRAHYHSLISVLGDFLPPVLFHFLNLCTIF